MNEWINTELNWWTVEIEEEKTLKLLPEIHELPWLKQ